jgi:hypothetical protein
LHIREFAVTLRSTGFVMLFTSTVNNVEKLQPTESPVVLARDIVTLRPLVEVVVPPGSGEILCNSGGSVKIKFDFVFSFLLYHRLLLFVEY